MHTRRWIGALVGLLLLPLSGWGVLVLHDAQGAISHRDVELRYERRLGSLQQGLQADDRVSGSEGD